MGEAALARWGRIDILVNNAGILRDKSFAKMDLEDFRLVLDVHLMGSVN
ncbi:SDR family NAD(P)-dependent oxidoreductase, partial [Vibrio parahaemolyticus]